MAKSTHHFKVSEQSSGEKMQVSMSSEPRQSVWCEWKCLKVLFTSSRCMGKQSTSTCAYYWYKLAAVKIRPCPLESGTWHSNYPPLLTSCMIWGKFCPCLNVENPHLPLFISVVCFLTWARSDFVWNFPGSCDVRLLNIHWIPCRKLL